MITPAVPIVILILGAVLGWFVGTDLRVPRASLAGFLLLWVAFWTMIAVLLSLERGRSVVQYLLDARGYHHWLPRTWYLQIRPTVIAMVVATGVIAVQLAIHAVPFLWQRTVEKFTRVMTQQVETGDFQEKSAVATADAIAFAGLIAVAVLVYVLWLVTMDGWRELLIRTGLARAGTTAWLRLRLTRALSDLVFSVDGSVSHRRTAQVASRLIALTVVMAKRGRFSRADLEVVESAVLKHVTDARHELDPVLFRVLAEVHAAVGPCLHQSAPTETASLVII